jgi:hypothetical protein
VGFSLHTTSQKAAVQPVVLGTAVLIIQEAKYTSVMFDK